MLCPLHKGLVVCQDSAAIASPLALAEIPMTYCVPVCTAPFNAGL